MSASFDAQPTWWAIEGSMLAAVLKRAHEGEEPEALYMELYANSEHEETHD